MRCKNDFWWYRSAHKQCQNQEEKVSRRRNEKSVSYSFTFNIIDGLYATSRTIYNIYIYSFWLLGGGDIWIADEAARGSSHLVKNASVLSISSCLFSPPHAPIALPSLPPPPTRHILDIFTPFYLHNCLHYPVRKGMSECRGGWPIASLPSAPRL